ncbi:endonuclease/exonuclease/phosphatase family protein [Streptomyces sp. NPDC048566]|uniref:endonuclease/exonuclease/phosphatase family protein n=1 Tax=Streptomyces sp. NPDC048566 TaxID=3365569 RepID=UPI0037110ABB
MDVRGEGGSAFRRHARVPAGVLIAACLLFGGPAAPKGSPFAGLGTGVRTTHVVANRVMTWNLCNPCGRGDVGRAAEIAAYAPQVVGVQEACVRDVEGIRDHLERLFGLTYEVEYGTVLRSWGRCGGPPWSPGGYGEAILSAAPMTDVDAREYPDGGSEDRGYLAVTTTVDGRSVRVVNTHLAERRQEAVRAHQVDVLAAVLSRYDRFVVLGDFNAVPWAPELAPLWALAEDADPGCGPSPAEACRPTTDWGSTFDYVFLRGVAASGRSVRPSDRSDHHLVYADLDTEPSAER